MLCVYIFARFCLFMLRIKDYTYHLAQYKIVHVRAPDLPCFIIGFLALYLLYRCFRSTYVIVQITFSLPFFSPWRLPNGLDVRLLLLLGDHFFIYYCDFHQLRYFSNFLAAITLWVYLIGLLQLYWSFYSLSFSLSFSLHFIFLQSIHLLKHFKRLTRVTKLPPVS